LDAIKLIIRYVLSGDAWNLLTEKKVAFTHHQNYGREQRQAQWMAISQSVVRPSAATSSALSKQGYRSKGLDAAEQARRRAELARYYLINSCLFLVSWELIGLHLKKHKCIPVESAEQISNSTTGFHYLKNSP
jgi:hypothetical protein